MDILIHTTSGMLMGTTMTAINPYRLKLTPRHVWSGLFLGGLAGALPDFDAISQWSQFDTTIGHWFGLASGDEIYSGRWWYSHHAFTHSLMASILFALLIFGLKQLKSRRKKEDRPYAFHSAWIAWLGWTAHLVGDLPTPKGSWDGIAYWWPSQVYVGGTGHTFWWNNYDIFLIIVLTLAFQILWMICSAYRRRAMSVVTTSLAIGLIIYQLQQRPMNFNDRSLPYQERERISLNYQKELLGDRIFHWMQQLDAALPVYF